jgi:hypothetical protein
LPLVGRERYLYACSAREEAAAGKRGQNAADGNDEGLRGPDGGEDEDLERERGQEVAPGPVYAAQVAEKAEGGLGLRQERGLLLVPGDVRDRTQASVA